MVFLNRKLLYAVLFKNLKTHLLLMFLFKNVLCRLALSLKACIIANGITVHLFLFCFSTPFLLLWSKNHQRLAQQNLGVLWLFQWGRWILFFKAWVKKSILQFLFFYWSHYLCLYLSVVSLQEFHVPSFLSLIITLYIQYSIHENILRTIVGQPPIIFHELRLHGKPLWE